MGGDDGPKKIKVVDRRWFTDNGQPREGLGGSRSAPASADSVEAAGAVSGATSEATAPRSDAGGSAAPTPDELRPDSESRRLPKDLTIVHLIDFLAQQAVILMSGAHGVTKDPDQARVFVDFLGVLEATTRGNLTPDEAGLLSDVLFQLRTLYVQSSQ